MKLDVSLCQWCFCMTHTSKDGTCLKCDNVKVIVEMNNK